MLLFLAKQNKEKYIFEKYFIRKFSEPRQPTTVSSDRIPQIPNIPVVSDIETLHYGNFHKYNDQSSGFVFLHDQWSAEVRS